MHIVPLRLTLLTFTAHLQGGLIYTQKWRSEHTDSTGSATQWHKTVQFSAMQTCCATLRLHLQTQNTRRFLQKKGRLPFPLSNGHSWLQEAIHDLVAAPAATGLVYLRVPCRVKPLHQWQNFP